MGDPGSAPSAFAVEEAQGNLADDHQRKRLEELIKEIEIGEAVMLPPERRGEIELPVRDWPILGGATVSGASHLITGDLRHFGPYFGQRVLGVLVQSPAEYLKSQRVGESSPR